MMYSGNGSIGVENMTGLRRFRGLRDHGNSVNSIGHLTKPLARRQKKLRRKTACPPNEFLLVG